MQTKIKRALLVVLAIGAAALLAACGSSSNNASSSSMLGGMAMGSTSAAQSTAAASGQVNAVDRAFVQQMISQARAERRLRTAQERRARLGGSDSP